MFNFTWLIFGKVKNILTPNKKIICIVNYQPPLRLLGAIANRLIIRKKLEERFGKMA